jgi:hypothetical protein
MVGLEILRKPVILLQVVAVMANFAKYLPKYQQSPDRGCLRPVLPVTLLSFGVY